MTARRVRVLVVAGILMAAGPAIAQEAPVVPGSAATVAAASPVFLRPDPSRTPLRTLPANTPLVVEQQQGQWLQVTWEDAAFGRRTGWIERRFVHISSSPARALPPTRDDPGAAAAAPARPPAQAPAPSRTARRAAGSPAPGFRVFGRVAWDRLSATDSFEAVTGKDSAVSFGGGVQVTNLWRGLFVEASIDQATLDGERVFAVGDQVFPLGIPVEITLQPIDVVGGWRVTTGRFTTFAGGGATFYGYEETSDFADDEENVDERKTGFVVLGGVEFTVMRWLHVRGDVRFRQVRDVLGVGGVSEVFGEDRLGGVGAAVSLVIGR
jgi:hypothetical protein